jgi:hypothetical protein
MIHFGTTEKLKYFQDLQKDWEAKNREETDKLDTYMKQYHGSAEIDGSNEEAKIVRNITYELIEAQVSTTIPSPRVTPKIWSEGHARNARRIEQRLKMIRDEQPFEAMNDLEERLVPIHGASARKVDWDNSYRTHDTVGRPEVQVLDVTYLTWQPGIYAVQDMDAIFVRYDTTKDDILLKYDKEYHEVEDAEPDSENDHPDDTVSVFTVWYRNESNVISKFVWTGDVVLEDVDNYWARKRYVCASCGERRELSEGEDGKCRCGGDFVQEDEDYEELTEDIICSDGRIIPAMSPVYENGKPKTRKVSAPMVDANGQMMLSADGTPVMQEAEEVVMAPTRLPYYKPDMYPVNVRKNTSKNRSLLGQSDCEFIRHQQQQINKLESNIHEKTMSAGVYPAKPARSKFVVDKSINQKVLELEDGVSARDYTVIDFSVNTLGDQQLSDRARDHAKNILGITNSFMGQEDTTAKSGVAKQVQVNQAAGRLNSKRVMKQVSYAECDEAIFKLDLAYADEPRAVSYIDEFGQTHNETWSRYDHYEYDEKTGEWYIDDQYTFSCDSQQGLDTQPELRWQMIASDFQSGMYGDPATTAAKLAAWLAREKAGYPEAHVQVEYFRAVLRAEREAVQQQAAAAQMQNNMIEGVNV